MLHHMCNVLCQPGHVQGRRSPGLGARSLEKWKPNNAYREEVTILLVALKFVRSAFAGIFLQNSLQTAKTVRVAVPAKPILNTEMA